MTFSDPPRRPRHTAFRRVLLFVLIGVLWLGAGRKLLAPTSQEHLLDVGNAFAAEYNIWANYRNQRATGTVDVREPIAWDKTKVAWTKMQKVADEAYK